MTEIIKSQGDGYIITINGKAYASILSVEGTYDSFEKIEDGAWKWNRHTNVPTDRMRMEVVLLGEPTFTMVPAVSYNGNGWGDTPEYVGDRDEDGTPWSFASHRVTIPACTYSENEHISIALMAEPNSNSACSLYRVDEGEKHVLIFPEEEKEPEVDYDPSQYESYRLTEVEYPQMTQYPDRPGSTNPRYMQWMQDRAKSRQAKDIKTTNIEIFFHAFVRIKMWDFKDRLNEIQRKNFVKASNVLSTCKSFVVETSFRKFSVKRKLATLKSGSYSAA